MISSSTVRKYLTALGTLFRQAARWEVLAANPASELEKPRAQVRQARYLSLDEYQEVKTKAPDSLRLLFRLAAVTGFRLKELTGLQGKDLDWKEGTISLSADNKTGKPRTIPMGQQAREIMEALIGADATLGVRFWHGKHLPSRLFQTSTTRINFTVSG